MKRFFYSLFFHHFCVSSPLTIKSKNTRGKGLEEESHYCGFKEKCFEMEEKEQIIIPENEIFILENANFKILAFLSKFSIKEEESLYELLADEEFVEKNPIILQYFTHSENSLNLLSNNHLFVIEMHCPDFVILENSFDSHNTFLSFNIEKVLGGSWVKLARKMEIFFLDLSRLVKPSIDSDIFRRISKILKMGLRLCNSLMIIMPYSLFPNIQDFAELFDNLFIDDSLFKYYLTIYKYLYLRNFFFP